MANMSENTIYLPKTAGNEELIADFKRAMDDGKFAIFEKYHPTPQEIDKKGWIDWRVANWGCKWCPSEIEIQDENDGDITFSFETPCDPPIAFFENFAKNHKDSSGAGQYLERAMYICGEIIWGDGICVNMDGSMSADARKSAFIVKPEQVNK